MVELPSQQASALETKPETTLHYREAVIAWLKEVGIEVSRDTFPSDNKDNAYVFTDGTEEIWNEDTERSLNVPIKVGSCYDEIREIVTETVFDENNGVDRHKTTIQRGKQIFRFESGLHTHFSKLLELIPESEIYRILQGDSWIEVHVYINLTPDEKNKLNRKATPSPEGVVIFLSGEWVLVDANDPNHKIASFGKKNDACRYWLLYDSVLRKAAATHLDLTDDVKVVNEMAGHLLRAGSQKQDLVVLGSENASFFVQQTVKRAFPKTTFDLNDDFVFDVATGERERPDAEVIKQFVSDDEATTRITENLEIRLKHNIPHVLVYKS